MNQITAAAGDRLLHCRRALNADGVECLVVQDDAGGAAEWLPAKGAEAQRLFALAPELLKLERDDIRNDACESVAARDAAPAPAAEPSTEAAFTGPAPAAPAPPAQA